MSSDRAGRCTRLVLCAFSCMVANMFVFRIGGICISVLRCGILSRGLSEGDLPLLVFFFGGCGWQR